MNKAMPWTTENGMLRILEQQIRQAIELWNRNGDLTADLLSIEKHLAALDKIRANNLWHEYTYIPLSTQPLDSLTNRHLWEQAMREDNQPTDDEAWNDYIKFVHTIFGLIEPTD